MAASEQLLLLAAIDKDRKSLSAQLKELQEKRNILEEQILSDWEQEGTTSQKVEGQTIYLTSRKWAKPKDGNRQAVVKALELLGMDDLVTFNTVTLSSYVNELEAIGEPLPPTLIEVLEFTEDFKIKTR